MTKLPAVSGRECVKALEKIGYRVVRKRGSHLRLKDINRILPALTVPDHKYIRPGLLKKILKDAGLTDHEFIILLK